MKHEVGAHELRRAERSLQFKTKQKRKKKNGWPASTKGRPNKNSWRSLSFCLGQSIYIHASCLMLSIYSFQTERSGEKLQKRAPAH